MLKSGPLSAVANATTRISFELSRSDLVAGFGASGEAVFATGLQFAEKDADGLIELCGETLRLTSDGRIFVRVIASWFDGYLGGGGGRYSRSV